MDNFIHLLFQRKPLALYAHGYLLKLNNLRPREYDGSHINFVGMNPEITLRPHQLNAIAHILYGGNTLLGHVVGATGFFFPSPSST